MSAQYRADATAEIKIKITKSISLKFAEENKNLDHQRIEPTTKGFKEILVMYGRSNNDFVNNKIQIFNGINKQVASIRSGEVKSVKNLLKDEELYFIPSYYNQFHSFSTNNTVTIVY